MTNASEVHYGDKITVALSRPDLPDAIISGTAEEPQPGQLAIAGWLLTDGRITITKHESQWLEPPEWQSWDALAFDGRRFLRVVIAKVTLPGVKIATGLPTVWRAVDEDLSLTDAELLRLMQGKRVVRMVLSEVWG